MSGRLRVALLAGGRSSEHEISLASARSVLAALDPARYDVVSVAIGRDGRWALAPASHVTDGHVLGPGPVTEASPDRHAGISSESCDSAVRVSP